MTPYPATIRARVHQSAIQRATRFFNATLDDAFVELLQNARRAGATRITVAATRIADSHRTVTVTDDGAGIPDPAILLSFGESAWSADTAAAEDPAGMGLYALSAFACTISSRPATPPAIAPGWRTSLDPDCFLGETSADVLPDPHAPLPHGTAVLFDTEHDIDRIEAALSAAAQHFPLPVSFNGRDLPRKAFLDGALHAETWNGLTFGVYRDRYRRHGDTDINFHGRTFNVGLPTLDPIHSGPWSVRADISACPEFELVLPARKEPVRNAFLKDMQAAALLAIYRAIAAHDQAPNLPYAHYRRAADAGIAIPQPAPALEPWPPRIADTENWYTDHALIPLRPSALLMAADPETHHGQALWRAAERAGISHRFFWPDRRFEGYPWYDALPRIEDYSVTVTHDGRTRTVTERASDERPNPVPADRETFKFHARPDRIAFHLHIDGPNVRAHTIDIPADVFFMGEEYCHIDDADPIVTADSKIEPHDLADLMRDAFFSPCDDAECDSHETQRDRFDQDAMRIALALLATPDDAVRYAIAEAIRREAIWTIPRDRKVTVTAENGRLHVDLGPAPPPPDPVHA